MKSFQQNLQKKISETIQNAREDGEAVDQEQLIEYKASLDLHDPLSSEQYNSALRALENVSVKRQLIAVQNAINNKLFRELKAVVFFSANLKQLKTARFMNLLREWSV